MTILQTFEYNGQTLQLAEYEPNRPPAKKSSRRAPGAGKFEIGDLSLSVNDPEIELSVRVVGENIAYIFAELLLKDPARDQFYGPVYRGYIQAGRDRQTGGLLRPDWDQAIDISTRLTPGLPLLTNGVDLSLGFLAPAGYDSSDSWLEGLYLPAGSASPRRARLTFDADGQLKEALAFKESRGRAASPHALTLTPGGQFTPFAQVLTPSTDDASPWTVTAALSNPLVIQEQPLKWQSAPALLGEYLAGLLVQDLDGAVNRKYGAVSWG